MAALEDIERIASAMRQLHPMPFFQKFNESQAGIGAVMGFLDESKGSVTAGMIAEKLGVSTARVAVLLKKMAAKGLIVKERDAADGRVTIVRFSEAGEKTARAMKANLYSKVGEVIDRVGMERLLEFIAVAREISQIVPRPDENGACCFGDAGTE